jgi:RimJ/RimL family protein N-acetyltransferase
VNNAGAVTHPIWPLFDLRLQTGELELRLPTEDDLVELIAVARAGIHPPDEMPFAVPWTELPSPEFERSAFQFHVGQRAGWKPEAWNLPLGVWDNGSPVGMQDIGARQFAATRTVNTGSWLGLPFQGRGIGKRMRQAVLALAFDHLGALGAETEAMVTNPASSRVSLGVGYRPNGHGVLSPRGSPIETDRYRMTLDDWRSRERPLVEVSGLEPCLELFGVHSTVESNL